MSEWKDYDTTRRELFRIGDNPMFSDEMRNMADNLACYIQRRITENEPKAPTHEEIMTKWWKEGNTWIRCYSYAPKRTYKYWFVIEDQEVPLGINKSWFIGRESADIPPEV